MIVLLYRLAPFALLALLLATGTIPGAFVSAWHVLTHGLGDWLLGGTGLAFVGLLGVLRFAAGNLRRKVAHPHF